MCTEAVRGTVWWWSIRDRRMLLGGFAAFCIDGYSKTLSGERSLASCYLLLLIVLYP